MFYLSLTVLTMRYVGHENSDIFCEMPFRMRMMCFVCTVLLLISLVTAIANSVNNSNVESVTYCPKHTKFHPGLLCPEESMLYYYKCCGSKCCSNYKTLLLVSVISLLGAVMVVMVYSVMSSRVIATGVSNI
ncbi:unnamed protein product [Bursaphelenchus okinawaensis]|uniref:Uncharacterized protein n=1 Tax=Bursaphelenchus okinawaensis TaxID=465554 RepID=A0A811KUS9_9BILA|nr:unnamed protein product [Bursaphelenchus okinawaensis]CAG9112450.1 unnamed protein product [Bursaphelenchus okinawaensis]